MVKSLVSYPFGPLEKDLKAFVVFFSWTRIFPHWLSLEHQGFFPGRNEAGCFEKSFVTGSLVALLTTHVVILPMCSLLVI